MDFIRMTAFGLNGLIRNRGVLSAAIDTGDVCRAEVEADSEADFGVDFEGDFKADGAALEIELDPLPDVVSAKFEPEVEAACTLKKTKFIPNESK